MVADVLTVEAVLAGLAGGALGAAIGGFPALGLAGVLVVVGEAVDIAAGPGAVPDVVGTGFTATVGLGPALGPHVAFAGGAAAAAYAARHGRVGGDSLSFEAKDLAVPLGSAPDVLLAGGLFGAVGVLLAGLVAAASLPLDPVAAAVVVSAVGHRLAFGYPLVGSVEGEWLDMGPYARREPRKDAPEAAGRLAVEPWQPVHTPWAHVLGLGAAVGLFGAYLGIATGSALLAFGVAAALVLFRTVGLERVPIVYHVALPASIAALGLAGIHPVVAMVGGAVAGVVGAVVGELAARGLVAHADTYLDPAFASILVTSLLLSLLSTAGLLAPAAVPYPVL